GDQLGKFLRLGADLGVQIVETLSYLPRRRSPRAFRGDELAGGRGHLGGEALDRRSVVGGEEERCDAVVEGEFGELLRPLCGRADEVAAVPGGEPAPDVEQAADPR